jgi:hypothetical protein
VIIFTQRSKSGAEETNRLTLQGIESKFVCDPSRLIVATPTGLYIDISSFAFPTSHLQQITRKQQVGSNHTLYDLFMTVDR